MKTGSPLSDEEECQQVLQALRTFVVQYEPELQEVVRLIVSGTDCAFGAISVVDDASLRILASPVSSLLELACGSAFCAWTILDDSALIVRDARIDPRFAGNPLLTMEPPTVFYAGMPIKVKGHRVGTVFVTDRLPRTPTEMQVEALRETAAICSELLETRLTERRVQPESATQWLETTPEPREFSGRALLPQAASQPAATLRVLYVEDNRINAILFEEAVRLCGGVELQIAESGADALTIARTWHPEVLVLDAHLPDTDGYALLPELRALPALSGVPAYMCSADAAGHEERRAAAAGFAGYWSKPIDVGRVMDALNDLRRQTTAG
jgi:CheY-like chemotaxis protein